MHGKLLWLLLVPLLSVVLAQVNKTDPDKSHKCYADIDGDRKGINIKHIAGNICFLTTKYGYSVIGNDELVRDSRTDILGDQYADTVVVDETWKLEVYPIQDRGQDVFGWFHVVLSGDPSTASIVIVTATIEAPDGFFTPTSGLFYLTSTKEGPCAESPGAARNKTKYIPCNFAQDPLPFAGRVFSDVVPGSGGLSPEYHLNYKLVFPRCNFGSEKYGLIFRAYVIGKKGDAENALRFAQSKRLTFEGSRVNYVVAVDPFPPLGRSLTCSNAVVANMPPWIKTVDTIDKSNSKDLNKFSALSYLYFTCTRANCYIKTGWSGRCHGPSDEPYPKPNNAYRCKEEEPETGDLEDYYKDYVPRVKAATVVCVNETNCTKYLNQRMEYGEDVGSPIGKYIWGARKGHGILMSVAGFLAYPLTAFFARYYKETYMKSRAVINLHVWYAAHICGSFTVLSMIISGTGVAIYGRLFYGHSTSVCGVLHRIFGWLGAVFFLLGMLTSGFRIAPIPTRKIAIFGHFLIGILYQILNVLSMLTCACIPGSPPGTEMLDQGKQGSVPLFWVLIFVWIGLEVVMNILASLQISQADGHSEFIPRRTYVFGVVPMPSLTPDYTKDLLGTARREALLYIYIVGNTIITVLALILIIYPDVKGRYFGKMDLTHFKNGSNRFADNYDEYAEID